MMLEIFMEGYATHLRCRAPPIPAMVKYLDIEIL
jgi:hypothetical protein